MTTDGVAEMLSVLDKLSGQIAGSKTGIAKVQFLHQSATREKKKSRNGMDVVHSGDIGEVIEIVVHIVLEEDNACTGLSMLQRDDLGTGW